MPGLLSKALGLPKKLDIQRTPLAKSVAMLTAMSFSHPCLKFSTGEVLGVVYAPTNEEPIS